MFAHIDDVIEIRKAPLRGGSTHPRFDALGDRGRRGRGGMADPKGGGNLHKGYRGLSTGPTGYKDTTGGISSLFHKVSLKSLNAVLCFNFSSSAVSKYLKFTL